MSKFNALTPDDKGVKYFSYGACFEPDFTRVFRVPWGVVYEREGPNDGCVSIESSKWGEYQGTLKDVHHLDVVGWTGNLRRALAGVTGKAYFDPVLFFMDVAESLAERGF